MNQQKKREALPENFKETWSISIYSGDSFLDLKPGKNAAIPTITRHDVTDISASFVADPFMIQVDKTWYLFMEIMNTETGLGEIGLVTSTDGLVWEYQRVILKEKYHLSYPFVFEHEEEYFMVPETLDANAVRLYKAASFPYNWEFVCNLTEGQYADPTLLYHNKLWWMFASHFPKANENLHLFYAKKLTGPYIQHPQSPLIEKDKQHARPAGRINLKDGHLIRLCQDCFPVYGSRVRAFEITELTTKIYSEKELPQSPVLRESTENEQWNTRGMHHLDAHQIGRDKWLACVDGCYENKLVLKKRAVWIFDDSYKVPTFLSVASFREHMDTPITLVYLGIPTQELIDIFSSLGGKIEFISDGDKEHMIMKKVDRHRKNRFMRMELMERWPREQVLLLDGDTVFSEKIKDLFPLIDERFKNIDPNHSLIGGITEDNCLPNFFTMKRNKEDRLVKSSEKELFRAFQYAYGDNWKLRLSGVDFNNGVLLIYNCVELAKAWKLLYQKGIGHPRVNPEDDQVPLSVAIFDLKTPVMQIDDVFNSKGELTGNYAVYHAWNNKWKPQLKKIQDGENGLEDYGFIALKHFQKMPAHWLENKLHCLVS